MRLESEAFLDFITYLLGKPRGVSFRTRKHYIATLDVGLDVSGAELFKNGNKHFHGQSILPTDVDASEKRDIGLHLITVSQ